MWRWMYFCNLAIHQLGEVGHLKITTGFVGLGMDQILRIMKGYFAGT